MASHSFLEFFAGGGMARAGLGSAWRCLFANDLDAMKVATYERNWGGGHIVRQDIAKLTVADLPADVADLSWASFPCQDLSLAGVNKGLGRDGDDALTRSGTFWPFWRLTRGLIARERGPRLIVLENVYGCLTSHQGKDFAAIAGAISEAGYRFGAVIVDASHFVPQSRPRLFFIAVAKGQDIPAELESDSASAYWHPPALAEAVARLPKAIRKSWIWWRLAPPPLRNATLSDIVEPRPTGVKWHTADETKRILSLMSPLNLGKVAKAKSLKTLTVGAVYRRTRSDENGAKVQRAELRFDGIAGCLRTPAGGSSRQTILVIEGRSVRSRLLSPREAARLMGLSDDYLLPERYNDAYHVCGDGVCAPVVRHIAAHLLEPILATKRKQALAAAE
jgi:DNA (cytosine-5)-methyltransferase 1